MGKFVLSFFFFFAIASTAHAEYECATNPNAEGCNPTAQPVQATENIDGEIVSETEELVDGKVTKRTVTRSKGAAEPPQSCSEPAEKAKSLCTLGDSSMSGQVQMAVRNATQMMQSGGTEAACKAAKYVQAISGIANAAHAGLCQAELSKCVSACGTAEGELEPQSKNVNDPNHSIAKKQLPPTRAAIKMCKSLQVNVVASGMSALGNVMGFAMSQKCQSSVTTGSGGMPPTAMDCSNPAMASMPSCVCAANPADPVCTASNGGLGDGGFSSVGNGSGAVDGGKDPEMFGFDDELPQLAASGAGAGAGAQGSSGGGGGMNGGGGAGALPPEEMGGGSGGGPYNTDVMGGLTGGGGAGGSSFGRGGSGESSSGGGLLDGLAAKFNLKGFLPSKADFKNRGLASGMKADGITGPNGPSLFEKVSSRYLKKQSEFLP